MVTRARGEIPPVPVDTRWSVFWRQFWALPLVICVSAVLLGLLLPQIDSVVSPHVPYVFQGGPDGARALLGTIASAMISVTGLVFSITMVVLQLASSQFTPRVLSGFLHSRVTQATLGVFTASFVFALTVLRVVRGGGDGRPPFVPQLSVTVAFLLVIASVALFLAFIHHITTSIQVYEVISRIGDDTMNLIDRTYSVPTNGGPGVSLGWSPSVEDVKTPISSGDRHGRVSSIDYDGLAAAATDHDGVVVVHVQLGEFVTEDECIATIWGNRELDEDERNRLGRRIWLGTNRVLRQDVGFGLRQLVDIAERALSPGVNDPTTATQVIDELHRLLRVLVQRESPSPYIDKDGQVRLVHRPQAVEDLLRLSVEETLRWGADSLQVPRRLSLMLADLSSVTADRYRDTVEEWRRRVDEHVEGEAQLL